MVNNLVFKWPKPLFFMVLGAYDALENVSAFKHGIILGINSLNFRGGIPPKKNIKGVSSMSPKTMKNKGFGHLKTRLFTIKTSKHFGLGGPWYILYIYIYLFIYIHIYIYR